ncbi:hypothetical protein A5N15_05285 [Rothia kristinae]|uniref:Uncharacterized protein n=1 Tax=Rothia kristinae TaxID=37923 RepID=A0A657IV07_9MICC|nr:hypothetical protein A5N15_05285 [Rothia kristinae]
MDDVCARRRQPAFRTRADRDPAARRAAGGPAEKTFGSLIGLELRPRRLREASEFWRAYGEQHGAEARDALWEAPENLPTDEDLDHPEQFESTHDLLHATDEEMDAALEKLLSGGYEDGGGLGGSVLRGGRGGFLRGVLERLLRVLTPAVGVPGQVRPGPSRRGGSGPPGAGSGGRGRPR